MNDNDAVIDDVIAEFEWREAPIRLGRNVILTRRSLPFRSEWVTSALNVAKTYKPSRVELSRMLRGRINLDRRMVLQTIARLIQEEHARRLVAAGESEDMARIIAEVMVPLLVSI